MRKLALLLAFLMIGAFVFAQEEESEEMTMPTMEEANQAIADLEALKGQVGSANLVPSFSGDATLTFGVLLPDTGESAVRMGFQNSASSSLSLELIDQTAEKGEGDLVGYIKLDGIDIDFADDAVDIDDPSVEAKIILTPLSIKIYSAPSFSVGNAAGVVFDPESSDARNTVKPALSNENYSAAASSSDSTEVLIVADADVQTDDTVIDNTTFTGYTVVERTTTETTAATSTTYQGLTVTVDLDAIDLNVMLASDGTWANPIATDNYNDFAFGVTFSGSADPLGFSGGVLLGPTDDLDIGATVGVDFSADPITVDVGFDAFIPNGGDFAFDASVGIGLALGVAQIDLLTYLDGSGADLDLDQGISVDLSGLADPLTFTTSFDLVDILTTGALGWESDTSVSYDLGGIKPFATVGLHSVGTSTDTVIAATAGVEFSALIENTVFTLQYANTDFNSDGGAITFATKISY